MVGVQNEKDVQRAFQCWVRRVFGLCHLEHHVQEIAGIGQVIIGIDVTQATIVPESVRGDRRHFGDETFDLHQAILGVVHLVRFGVKR